MRRRLHRDGLLTLLRRELATTLPPSDYGVPGPVLVVVGAVLLSDGRRLRHLRHLDGDPSTSLGRNVRWTSGAVFAVSALPHGACRT